MRKLTQKNKLNKDVYQKQKRSSDKHSTPSGTIDVGRREKRSAEKKCKKVTEWPVNNSEVQQTRSQFFPLIARARAHQVA